jgi:hypothetical protein
MNAIEALIQRMDQAPEEFAEDGSWKHTRWADITDIMVAESQMTPRVFTQEENVAYMSKLGAIVRKQLEEHICIEILNPLRSNEKAPQQMNLFPAQTAYPPGTAWGAGGGGGSGLITANTIKNEALRVLEEEMFKHRDVHKDMAQSLYAETQAQRRAEEIQKIKEQQKERDGVMRRMQNALRDLVKQTP